MVDRMDRLAMLQDRAPERIKEENERIKKIRIVKKKITANINEEIVGIKKTMDSIPKDISSKSPKELASKSTKQTMISSADNITRNLITIDRSVRRLHDYMQSSNVKKNLMWDKQGFELLSKSFEEFKEFIENYIIYWQYIKEKGKIPGFAKTFRNRKRKFGRFNLTPIATELAKLEFMLSQTGNLAEHI